MVATGKAKNRIYIGGKFEETCELPDLIGIQKDSYESFLQSEKVKQGLPVNPGQGLEDVFESTFPISSQNNDMTLNFESYQLDFENIKFSEIECKRKGRTYSVPLRARISLELAETGEIRETSIFFGDLPLMTERGTFIINGAERVVVSQIHRSPGVIFSHEKDILS
ncbi:MAG: DNA-directed RNA polymerase subunit beta, partial [Sphaerochaetaceae bacterium]